MLKNCLVLVELLHIEDVTQVSLPKNLWMKMKI